jgi:UDP-N-acetylmuramate dehydrogenase
MSQGATSLAARFGKGRVRQRVELAPFTTFKVGGPADYFLEPHGRDEIVEALALAGADGLPVTLLGGGSNVLIADSGIRGLVLRPRGGEVERVAPESVRADGALTINGLVRWTILHGAAGLEAWAGTPGTVGGAVHGNAHFAGRQISELVQQVELADRQGIVRRVPASAMEFAYDRSRLQRTGEVLLSADFSVTDGEPSALRDTARASLAFRKRTQPLESPSAGCIFQNPQPGVDVLPEGMPWSAGALVDRAGLKGQQIGGALVSPAHANFIISRGGATAAEIRTLIERCRAGVRDQFGVTLRNEIVYLGDFS